MLGWITRFLLYILGLIGIACLALWIFGYSYLFRGVRLSYLKGYTSANIYDGKDFDTRKVQRGNKVSALPKAFMFNQIALSDSLNKMLELTGSTSFMIVKNDSIVYEKYFSEHTETSRSNSFSMAKTITTLMVEMAIEEGKIPGWETPVKKYLPWLQGPYADALTLRNLSNMTAGLDWSENYYNPFGITAEAYYGYNIEKTMHRVKVVDKPGQKFVYQSGATQLLGLCLRAATGKNLSDYASEKLWQPLGAEADATWHTDDKNGTELNYCCFNAVTRDFARLGQIILHNGSWNGHKFVDSAFVATMRKMVHDSSYGQSLWLGHTGNVKWCLFQGTLGQYIIVIPEKNILIIRTGNHQKKGKRRLADCIYTYAEEVLKNPALR